ncbi:hypothetical protein J6590_057369 [Homalodisca vitripennis]|nr:hypothetical protein J6590_057369 [Homalodisca vitripennis]
MFDSESSSSWQKLASELETEWVFAILHSRPVIYCGRYKHKQRTVGSVREVQRQKLRSVAKQQAAVDKWISINCVDRESIVGAHTQNRRAAKKSRAGRPGQVQCRTSLVPRPYAADLRAPCGPPDHQPEDNSRTPGQGHGYLVFRAKT